MKSITRLSILLLCALLAACASKKHAVTSTTVVPDETTVVVPPSPDSSKPAEVKPKEQPCITSKLRLELSSGSKSVTVGGTLRMKHDDVIQLSLTTFGILEVARIEITPDYFMAVDKMGKQYIKAAYADVSFLKTAGRNYYDSYTPWGLASALALECLDRTIEEGKSLPTKHNITIPSGSKTIKANLSLSNMNTDSNWETRTVVSSHYKEVTVDEAITRILNLTK